MHPDRPHPPAPTRTDGRIALALAATILVLVGLVLTGTWAGGHSPSWDGEVTGGNGSSSHEGGVGHLTTRDGFVPVGGSISPFAQAPAITKLKPPLRRALHRAAAAAHKEGVVLRIDSGWRSPRYQRELLRRAVDTYGSVAVARRYVMRPSESSHVAGEAIDVGPTEADSWLSQHGYEYGLCQTFANEMWHFQLATEPGRPCPAGVADATDG